MGLSGIFLSGDPCLFLHFFIIYDIIVQMNEQNQPVIGIYVGHGASHSWTWFADIFEKFGCYNVKFIDEADVEKGLLTDCNVFFISGGDTFAIAEGLGKPGAEEIERFVINGGIYIGSCAGAYLPLRSSLKPLNHCPQHQIDRH